MAYVISRPMNGISLNGEKEYLELNGKLLTFSTTEEAEAFCKKNGIDLDGGFVSIEYQDDIEASGDFEHE